MEEKTTYI